MDKFEPESDQVPQEQSEKIPFDKEPKQPDAEKPKKTKKKKSEPIDEQIEQPLKLGKVCRNKFDTIVMCIGYFNALYSKTVFILW